MTIEITGRNVDVTPALRHFAEDKLRKLERLLDGPLEIHVVLGIEKHRHMAEIQVKSKTTNLSGAEETGDLYASIGEVADKLERQALKHKEKTRTRRHRRGHRASESASVIREQERIPDQEDAGDTAGVPRVVRSGSYRLKPMSVEDALLELEAGDEDLIVYRDAASHRVNVVYRRKDGNYGLIDPD